MFDICRMAPSFNKECLLLVLQLISLFAFSQDSATEIVRKADLHARGKTSQGGCGY
ncbi:MAG: hypothetical protein ACKOYC_01850 [Bacteroidota bacterium]